MKKFISIISVTSYLQSLRLRLSAAMKIMK